MVFSSILFLFRFLPVTLLLYYIAPVRWRNALLLLLSLVFYTWGEVRFLPIMLCSALIDYFMGLCIQRYRHSRALCRLFLGISLAVNLGLLGFFKYAGFFVENVNNLLGWSIKSPNILLPLGISFYTFQTMAYTIDVYRDSFPAERSFVDYCTFVTLFPQLIAGPIVKYSDINRELRERRLDPDAIQRGVFTFIMGLGSKVLIANNIGALWSEVEELGFANISTPLAWMGILAFALQIFFDFSGYSLMAIGLGRMLGFTFPQNFNYPYISRSVTEFWRRWHMTLSGWFREYVYIPLGGNRKGRGRQYLNLFVVWALTGLWHGASWNFVLWGLFFFFFLCVEKLFLLRWLERSRVLSRIYLLFLVTMGWVLFAITDFGELGIFLGRLFRYHPGAEWVYYLRNYLCTFVAAAALSTPLLEWAAGKLRGNRVITTAFALVVLLFSVAYLVDSSYNPFLYFRF